MYYFRTLLLTISALSLVAISCVREPASEVNQDSIYGEYRLVYDAKDDKTYARASFRFGSAAGTILELVSPGGVSFEGDSLAWRPILAYYEKEYAGSLNSGTFSYTDLDANNFQNTATLAKAIGLPASLDSLPKGGAYTLSWEGDPITSGEVVTVTVNGINEGDARIFTNAEPGATSIVLDQDKIDQLGVGQGQIIIERYTPQGIQEGTSDGGLIWSRYISAPKTIQVVE